MAHFLERKDPWGNRMGLWILVLMAAVLPPAIWSLRGVDLDNDIKNWVPKDDPNVLTLDWYHEHFPSSESVLITWDGSSLNDPRVDWLVDRLEGVADADGVKHGGVKQFEEVITPQRLLRRIMGEDISLDEGLQRLQGILVGVGPLKLRLSERGRADQEGTLQSLCRQISHETKIQATALPAMVEWAPEKPLDAYKLAKPIVEAEKPEPFPSLPSHHAQIRWKEMLPRSPVTQRIMEIAKDLKASDGTPLIADAFFAQGAPIAVAAVLSEAGEADLTDSLVALRQVAAEVGIAPEALHLAGRPVANSELNLAVKRAAWNRDYPIWNLPGRSLVLFSGAVGIALAFFMLRNVPLTLIVLAAAYYTVLVTMALVPPTGGSMNMVLVVMPTLLLVTTLEGGIHIVNYWRYAGKTDPQNAVIKSVRMATWPCFLASFTTALGLMSLMTSTLTPVFDFGMYAAIGCMLGFVVVIYGVPSLLSYLRVKPAALSDVSESSSFWERVANGLVRYRLLVTSLCVVAAVGCSLGLQWFTTETKVIRYFQESSQVVKDYRFIEENIGGIVPVDIIVRFGDQSRAPAENGMLFAERQEIVRRIQARLVDGHPDVSGTISLATFRPALSTEELARRRAAPLSRRIDQTTEHKVKDPNSSGRNFVTEAAETVHLERVGRKLCEQGDELWRITAQVNIMTDSDYSVLTRDIDAILQEETGQISGVEHVVTGMVPLFLETQKAILTSLINSFWLAFLVIWVTMSLVVRNALDGLIAMIPNVLPVSVVFGLISWLGVAVDIGTMITASVALGIAVDGTLHMLTWYRNGVRAGRTRRVAIAEAVGHCGPALCQTGLVIGLGLIVLVPAELTLISRFGWLMAAMVAMALLGTLLWLPALLAGRLGESILRRELRAKGTSAADTVPVSDATNESHVADGTADGAPAPHFTKLPTAQSSRKQ